MFLSNFNELSYWVILNVKNSYLHLAIFLYATMSQIQQDCDLMSSWGPTQKVWLAWSLHGKFPAQLLHLYHKSRHSWPNNRIVKDKTPKRNGYDLQIHLLSQWEVKLIQPWKQENRVNTTLWGFKKNKISESKLGGEHFLSDRLDEKIE